MPTLRKLPLLMAFASLNIALSVQAQEDQDLSLDELVVTGTRSGSLLIEQAGNTGRVSERDIDLVRADHVSEIVNRVPGVMVQRGNGQEHLTSLRSPVLTAGAGAGSFLYLEDGIPLRAAGFANVNGLFEVNHEQAGGIEVVRGPGSAFYGSNAVHGLMNFLTRAPSLDLEREIDVSVGPNDLYRGKFTISDTQGRHGYRLSANGTTDGGYTDRSVEPDNLSRKAGYDQQKLTFRHDYYGDIDSFTTVFSATNLNQQTQGYVPGERAYRSKTASQTRYSNSYRDAKATRLSTRWDRQLSDNRTLSLTPYFRHTEMEFLLDFLPGSPVEKNKHTSAGLLADYAIDFDAGHRLIFGTDFEYTEGSLYEEQFGPNDRGFRQGLHYDYDVDATVVAPYVHGEWQVAKGTRVVTGLRYEYTRYEYSNSAENGGFGNNFRPADTNDTFHNVSPKLGVVQALTDEVSVFANYARGNRAPQTTDLYRLRSIPGSINDSRPARSGGADSEKMDSFEMGIRQLGDGLQYEITTYYMKKSDYFFRDSNNDNVPDGKTEHYGLEIGAFYPLSEKWDIAANLTFARHLFDFDYVGDDPMGPAGPTVIDNGNYMPSAPRRMANISLGWNFLKDSRAELEWVHVDKYFVTGDNNEDYSGHDVFNLRGYHAVTDKLTVYGRINNLFDTRYAERADFNNGEYRYFVGQSRGLHVGASYSF